MFRAQQNAFDDAVAKATDENLTSENWEYILDVCDKVTGSDSGPRDVVAAMIKRLAHRNANVQLYTFELANALSQNCGPPIHRELASRSFTDAMLRLAGDRTTHQTVKSKILERMGEWTEMFSRNSELGIMEQAYTRLKSQNPNLQPPQAPTKQQITDFDRQKEEEELQMALKLSIQDKPSSSASNRKLGTAELHGSSTAELSQPTPSLSVPSGTTAATVSRVRALFDFQPTEPGELQFRKGDVIAVLESVYKDWWKGSLRGQTGIFPLNYIEKLSDPTPDELQKEAQMEAEIFGEIKNVEKLLALLSTSSGDLNIRDNEEITNLYHSTLAIRPKLIELIGKYTQKKDDFQQLNEKFIKARRDYEAMLESSMAQPQQSHYGRPGQQQYGSGGGSGPPQGYPTPQRFYNPHADPPPPSGPIPFQFQQQNSYDQPTHAPYPISSPPPQNRVPSGPRPSQTQQGPPPQQDSYQPYSTQLKAGGPRPQTAYDHQQQPQFSLQEQQSQSPPHELGSSSYDSPIDGRPSHLPAQAPGIRHTYAQGQSDEYSASLYSTDDQQNQPPPRQHQQPPQSQPAYAPLPSQTKQSVEQPPYAHPPSHQPPPIPQSSPASVPQSSAYPTFMPSGPPAGYQPYQRPHSFMPQSPGAGGGNPASFYQ